MNSAQTLARDIALELQATCRFYASQPREVGPVSEAEPKHLLGMCEQVVANAETWPATKAHRWVGYIQGVLVALGLTTVDHQKSIVTRLREANEDL